MARGGGVGRGAGLAQDELAALLDDPDAQLAAKVASREQLAAMTKLSCRATRSCRTRSSGASRISPTARRAPKISRSAGPTRKAVPDATGTVPQATWFGAGFPDYPWIFGTDEEYTAFAAVPVGQFAEAAMDHLRALRDISDILNEGSGVVTHESVADGSIWFGHDSRRTNPDEPSATTSTPTRRSSSPAPSPCSGGGPGMMASATRCTTSRCAI